MGGMEVCEVQCFEMEPSEVQDFKKHPLLGPISNFPIDFFRHVQAQFPFSCKNEHVVVTGVFKAPHYTTFVHFITFVWYYVGTVGYAVVVNRNKWYIPITKHLVSKQI